MRRRVFATVTGPAEGEPFSAMNTTPLIDVLLVLLIMIILTIPVAVHEIPLKLPTQSGLAADAVIHELALTREGAVMLDGVAVDDAALGARLRRIATVGDALTIRTDPAARYDRFAETLAVVKRSGVERLGFAHGAPAAF